MLTSSNGRSDESSRNFSWDSGARAGFGCLQEKGSVRRGITPEINAVSVGLIVIWYRVRTRGLGLGTRAQELLERP